MPDLARRSSRKSPDDAGSRPGASASRRRFSDAAEATVRPLTREDCVELLLLSFQDLADRDDIRQATKRLPLVRRWIRSEAERAAADPVIAEPLPERRAKSATAAAPRRGRAQHRDGLIEWPPL